MRLGRVSARKSTLFLFSQLVAHAALLLGSPCMDHCLQLHY